MHLKNLKTILVSRTDAIGDVVLTLPLLHLLKKEHPTARIVFLGSNYTKDIILACKNVDTFLDWNELKTLDAPTQLEKIKGLQLDAVLHVFPDPQIARLMKKAQVPHRIGTRSRIYHFWTCNYWPVIHRKNSELHEAELNIELAIRSGLLSCSRPLRSELANMYDLNFDSFWPAGVPITERNVILHVGSRMSARNWPVAHYVQLAEKLARLNYNVYLTGTQAEGDQFREPFMALQFSNIHDLTGKMSLKELCGFIKNAQTLVAASTGPLHLAAALGIQALGIYPPIRPIHPGRWAPIGKKAHYFSLENRQDCKQCKNTPTVCFCMKEISSLMVLNKING